MPSDTNLGGGRGGGGGGGGGGGARRARRRSTAPAARSPATSRPIRRNPDIFYAGGNNGSFLTRLNRRTGELARGQSVSAHVLRRAVERARRALAVDVSRSSSRPSIRPCSTPRRSTCGRRPTADRRGTRSAATSRATIRRRWGRFGRADHAGHERPEVYGTVFALGPGKKDVNILWAGSDDGLVHVTRDGGKTWTNVTPKDMPDFGRVSQIDASSVRPRRRLRRGQAAAARRPRALHLPHARLRQDVDEDRHRHPGQRLRARRARGSDAPRPALRRHAARRLRLVSTTATLGVAVAQPARHAGLGPHRRGQLDRDRDARARLLHPRRHLGRCAPPASKRPARTSSSSSPPTPSAAPAARRSRICCRSRPRS